MEAKDKNYKILFLCNGNSVRSIYGEYLGNLLGFGRFEAYSAGASPRGTVDPRTLKVLKELHNIDAGDARSKSWDEYKEQGIEFDFVITVCDKAQEVCPVWPGQPIVTHWGFRDPAAAEGTEEEVYRVFRNVSIEMRRRIELFFSLPFDKLDRFKLEEMTCHIGAGEPEPAVWQE